MAVEKEETALRTIGEVAESLSLPAHVIRFWETKFPQLKPNKRRGRHRYYRPEDIEKIQKIRHLLYEQGYTIKGAQKVLRAERKADPKKQDDLFSYEQMPALEGIYNPPPKQVQALLSAEHIKRLEMMLEELDRMKHQLREDA